MITPEQRWSAYLKALDIGLTNGTQVGYEGSLIMQVLEASESAAWMPIDMAPKDGTVIEIYPVHKDCPQVNKVFWEQPYSNNSGGAWLDLGDQYNVPGYFLGQDTVTHWRFPAEKPES